MSNLNPDLVFGYGQLAKILSTTPAALAARKARGRLELEPVHHIGRTAVFKRQDAEALAKQEQAQEHQ